VADPADIPPDPIEVDGELVSEVRRLPPSAEESLALDRTRPATVPAVVAAATGGFVLGVAAFLLLKVLRRPAAARSLARRRRRLVGGARGSEIASTRSFLVDVHLLGR
jgi:hypothetical protein